MEILETDQDAFTYFNNYAKKLNGGESYFMKSVNAEELQKVHPNIACNFFNHCYLDPSSFVVVLVGDIDPCVARPLIEELLGGIPMPTEPVIRFQRDNLTLIPFNFPPAPVREEICRHMAGSKCCTKVTFPVNLSNLNMDEDEFVLDILRELIRIVVLGRLRHVEGQIYEVLVEQSHDGYNFASAGLTNSSITVEFLSSENTSYLLADAVVDEILQFQKEGPSQNDMKDLHRMICWLSSELWMESIRILHGGAMKLLALTNQGNTAEFSMTLMRLVKI